MKYIKSPMNYTGGKYKLLDTILPKFPDKIDVFVDLFSGGYNVGINVNADAIIANDHNTHIINLYKEIQKQSTESILEHIEKRISEYSLNKENQEGYLAFREFYNNSQEAVTLDLLILTFYAFNHQVRFNNNHKFNTPFGKNRSSYNESIKNNLIKFSERIKEQNLTFTSKDFIELDFNQLTQDSLVYCDPPYLISNAVYNDGKRGFKNWTNTEERQLLELLEWLDLKNVKFALSNVFVHKNQENTMLIEWSEKYNVHYCDINYSNSSYQLKERNSKTVEVLITNY